MLSRKPHLALASLLIAVLLAACGPWATEGAPDAVAEAPPASTTDTPARQAERGDGAVSTGPVASPPAWRMRG